MRSDHLTKHARRHMTSKRAVAMANSATSVTAVASWSNNNADVNKGGLPKSGCEGPVLPVGVLVPAAK